VATDPNTAARFRRYYRRFGVGMVLIRWLFLPAVRREGFDERRSAPRLLPIQGDFVPSFNYFKP